MSFRMPKSPLAWRGAFLLALILADPAQASGQGQVYFPSQANDSPLQDSGESSEAVDLGSVVVEEFLPKTDAPSLDSTSAATVILPQKSPDPTATVPSLIEETAGVHVKRYGGLDDFSALSLRGSTSSQVQIYLDDVPLVSAQGNIIDLSIIPLEAMERIEVYRGGSPGMVPDSTAGGVVILRTKVKPDKASFVIRNTGASFTTYRGTISAAAPFKKCSLIATYERFQSDGNFTYIDNNGTTFNTNDDQLVERQNNDFASNSMFTKFIVSPNENTSIAVFNTFFNKDQGVPGLGNRQSTIARLETWRDLVAIQADHDFTSVSGLSLHGDLFFDFLNSQFNDPLGQIGLGVERNDDNTYRFGEDVRAEYSLGAHQLIKAFTAHRSEFFIPVNHAATPSDGPHSRRHTISAGLEDEIHLWNTRLTIIPSVRLVNAFNYLSNQDPSNPVAIVSTNTRSDHQLSAKLGLKLRLINELYFKGNFYRGFRNPTFSELFGDQGTIIGNPTLRPEKSLNVDAGFAFHYANESIGADIETIFFRDSVDDLIQFLQTSQFTIRPQNMSRALIQGGEFSARILWKDRIQAYANYTLQWARDASSQPATSGKYLPGRPKDELAVGMSWNEQWKSWFGTKLSSDINYMAGNYIDTQNLISVKHRSLISASAAVVFLKKASLSMTVKNLLNEHIEDIVGYPLPGRSYWATLDVKFL